MKILADNLNTAPRHRLQLREITDAQRTWYAVIRIMPDHQEITIAQAETRRAAWRLLRQAAAARP